MSCGVRETLKAMQMAIQKGDFDVAGSLGNAGNGHVPLAVPQSSISFVRTLSDGAQATVYEADVEGIGRCAVKKGRIREPEDLVRLREEVALLAELKHPHLVELLAARMLPPHYSMILKLESTNVNIELYQNEWIPGWPGALHLGAQVASAVAHMHSNSVIHRDIKPANILLSEDLKHAKLADLGISHRLCGLTGKDLDGVSFHNSRRNKPSGGFHKEHMVGTMEYLSPEVLVKRPHSIYSDVYALAVTINEIASRSIPYSDCTRDNPLAHTILEMGYSRQELATAVVAEGLRPTIPDGTPYEIIRLLKSCWNSVPERRPTASELAIALEKLSSQYSYGGVVPSTRNSSALKTRNESQTESKSNSLSKLDRLTSIRMPQWAEKHMSEHHLLSETGKPLQVAIASFATPGARGEDKMEDRCIISRNLFGIAGCYLLAVFDGHRGPEAAEYLADNIEEHIMKYWEESPGPTSLLVQALIDADDSFQEYAKSRSVQDKFKHPYPGSTATIVLVTGHHIAAANIGDSGAVLNRGGIALALTEPHTASRPDERERIIAISGEDAVHYSDHGWRIGQSGLAITRSVGDADLKDLGVCATADVMELELQSQDSFILLGTDGLWDHLNYSGAIELVNDTVKHPAMIAQRLVNESLLRGSKDNVTAVVLLFCEGSSMENGSPEKVYSKETGHKYHAPIVSDARVAARMLD